MSGRKWADGGRARNDSSGGPNWIQTAHLLNTLLQTEAGSLGLRTASRLTLYPSEPYQRVPEAKGRAGSDLLYESSAEFKNAWSSSSVLSLHGVSII